MTLIADRPASGEYRRILGEWEGDLIIGKANKSAIGTLVERNTGTVILLHIPDAKHRLSMFAMDSSAASAPCRHTFAAR